MILDKDIVLITGGCGNIAKHVVNKYLAKGEKVIAVDVIQRKFEHSENENYEFYKVDVTNIEQIQELYKNIESKYGRITHLISAAGTPMKTEIDGLETATFEDIEKSINLNLKSHIYFTKIFLPLMEKEEKNKSITLVSSVNAIKTFNLPIYSAAKAGIIGFMKAMTKDLGKRNIRINVVLPGTVPTEEDIASNGNFYNYRYKEMLALNDFTKPQDIADAIYCITNDMLAVTGQSIVVDSGQIS